MSELGTIMRAVNAFGNDHDSYPGATSPPCPEAGWDPRDTSFPPRAWPLDHQVAEFRASLEPEYISSLPIIDPWGHPYRYAVTPDGCYYTIASLGRDGRLDAHYVRNASPRDEAHDLLLYQGVFISLPEGRSSGP